jgi:glyoxylase-like metal-dependent hydrolase (beta-lactamase superfamily II)
MKESVDRLQIIRSGNTIRDPEVWENHDGAKIRDLERDLGVLNLSTVTLIETDSKKILIDISWEGQKNHFSRVSDEENRLALELKYFGVKPSEIDEIFITHWHGDHWENIYLFPQAIVHYAGCAPSQVKKILDEIEAENETVKLKEGEEWHSGLEIMDTHGHTDHDHSVIIRYKKKNYVATGDSIVSKMYYHTGTFFPNARVEKFHDEHIASFKKIVERADFIIPGHDGPFVNYKKDEL